MTIFDTLQSRRGGTPQFSTVTIAETLSLTGKPDETKGRQSKNNKNQPKALLLTLLIKDAYDVGSSRRAFPIN